MKFDLKYLEKLTKLMNEGELTELLLEDQEQSIILKREKQTVTAQQLAPVVEVPQVIQQDKAVTTFQEPQTEVPKTEKAIKSPMVGTFYKAAAPDAPAFVEVGSLVAQGEVVCIIEAMKLMNEIQCEYDCEIEAVLVSNEQKVEFTSLGDNLYEINQRVETMYPLVLLIK